MQQVIIFCEENLRRTAWLALLDKQPGVTPLHAVGTIPELLRLPFPEPPHTIFADVPGVEVSFVEHFTAAFPGGSLLLLIDDYQVNELAALLQAGATGVISQSASPSELVQALIAVGRGEIVVPLQLASKVMLLLARGEAAPPHGIEPLTVREQQVLAHLAQGLTNKDIAQTLFLSVRTIEAHLRNIYSKLNVASRTEAVLWAVQQGLKP